MIKSKRRKLNLNQKRLAELLNIDQSYISDLENKKRTPSFSILKKLCIVLDICPIKMINFFIDENDNDNFKCCNEVTNCLNIEDI